MNIGIVYSSQKKENIVLCAFCMVEIVCYATNCPENKWTMIFLLMKKKLSSNGELCENGRPT